MENKYEGIRSVHPNRLKPRGVAILAVIGILLLALALYYLPWPTHIQCSMPGAEVDLEGNVIASGVMGIEGWVYNYLFQHDEFKLTHLELPNRQVGQIYDLSYFLGKMYPYSDIYMTNARIELSEYTSKNDYTAHIFLSEDQSCWVTVVTGRIFVGTTTPNADYDEIMDFWDDLINGLIDN